MSFKQPRYALLFACCAILVLILVTVLAASAFVDRVKSTPDIATQFNFPRYFSSTESAAPAMISSNVRYTFVATDAMRQGREIDWAGILRNGSYDVIIIGDSFLGGVNPGKDLCRKISAEHNVSVLHIYTNNMAYANGNPFRMLTFMTNNGFLEQSGARVVILEHAERTLPGRIIKSGPVTDSEPLPRPAVQQKKGNPKKDRENRSFIDSALITLNKSAPDVQQYLTDRGKNILTLKTWVKNDILSLTASQSNDGSFRFVWMNESRFTSPVYHSRLIFYKGDIDAFHGPDALYPDDYIHMNTKLNSLAGRLRNQNITLIFMPAVSAYNTYYPYITDPPTVRNPLFEILRELRHDYMLVDTKEIVSGMQEDGEKDLSGVGDPTHWTWKVTEAIADELDLNAKPVIRSGDASDEYERAVRAFRSVVYERGEHQDAWAYRIDGKIYDRAGDYQNATLRYRQSLDLDPRQPEIRSRLSALSGQSSGN